MFKFGFVVDAAADEEEGGGGNGPGPAAGGSRWEVDVPAAGQQGPGGEAGTVTVGGALLPVAFCQQPERRADAPGRRRWGESDLVEGEYEGGYKLWEGALDLLEYIDGRVRRAREAGQRAPLLLDGASVAELGCGHGLPGIACCRHYGAARLLLQDYNEDVLRSLTARNVLLNLPAGDGASDVRFAAGDWSGARSYLEGSGLLYAFDLVVSAETAYNLANLGSLVDAIHAVRAPLRRAAAAARARLPAAAL